MQFTLARRPYLYMYSHTHIHIIARSKDKHAFFNAASPPPLYIRCVAASRCKEAAAISVLTKSKSHSRPCWKFIHTCNILNNWKKKSSLHVSTSHFLSNPTNPHHLSYPLYNLCTSSVHICWQHIQTQHIKLRCIIAYEKSWVMLKLRQLDLRLFTWVWNLWVKKGGKLLPKSTHAYKILLVCKVRALKLRFCFKWWGIIFFCPEAALRVSKMHVCWGQKFLAPSAHSEGQQQPWVMALLR